MKWSELYDQSRNAAGREVLCESIESERLCSLFSIYECETVNELVKMILTFRNCCCGTGQDIVKQIIQAGLVLELTKLCRFLAMNQSSSLNLPNVLEKELKFEIVDTTVEKPRIIVAISQFLCNFTASSTVAADYVMSIQAQLIDVLAAACHQQHRPSIACCWNMLYNCICHNKPGFESRREKLLQNRPFLCTLMLSIQSHTNLSTETNSSTNTSNDQHQHDPVLEWAQMMTWQWIQQGLCGRLFALLASNSGKTVATVEQLIFLQLFLQCCQDSSLLSDLQTLWLSSSPTSNSPEVTVLDMKTFWQVVFQQFQGIVCCPAYEILHPLALAELTTALPNALPPPAPSSSSSSASLLSSSSSLEQVLEEKDKALQQSIAQDFVLLVWDTLSAFLAIVITPTTSTLTSSTTPCTTADAWLAYLVEQEDWLVLGQRCLAHYDMIARHKYIGQLHKQLPPHSNTLTLKAFEKQWLDEHFTAFHQNLIKAVLQTWQHTLAYSAYLQSYIHEEKGHATLHVLLAYCVTDFYNPLTREWAFFTIHALTQHHAGIRAYLDSLQLQDVEINKAEELQKAGIEVQMNKETGKISFVQKKPPTS